MRLQHPSYTPGVAVGEENSKRVNHLTRHGSDVWIMKV